MYVFTVFQKKMSQGDADLYSLPTKQGERQVIWTNKKNAVQMLEMVEKK